MRRTRALPHRRARADCRSLPELAAQAEALLAQAEARGITAGTQASGRGSLLQHPAVAVAAAFAVAAVGVIATSGHDISGGEPASQAVGLVGDWLGWAAGLAQQGVGVAAFNGGVAGAPASKPVVPASKPSAAAAPGTTTAADYARSLAVLSEHFGEKQPSPFAAATRPSAARLPADDYQQAQALLEQHFAKKR
jgi:hypothetical protein